jgi:hypothetical protein
LIDQDKKKADLVNQIVSTGQQNMEESNLDETAVDERGEENHEEYCQSQIDNEEYMNNLYDPSDFMFLDINSKSKARSLKNLILEKKNLKKANILLFKQMTSKDKLPSNN